MADVVKLESGYFANPDIGRPVANGTFYVGDVDTDPEIVGNQKQVTVREEDGTEVQITQPVDLSAGGVPTYNGSTVTVLVDGPYSIKVLDSHGAQKYYIPESEASISDLIEYDHNEDGSHIVYSSIADLRASTLTPFDGQKISTTGTITQNDGGGGDWVWVPSSVKTDNTGTVVKLTSITTGRFERLFGTEIRPEWWGTGSTSMQAAVDSGGQLVGQDTFGPGMKIVLSSKQYTWDTQIDIYSHTRIVGAGQGSTEIDFSGTGYCFKGVPNSNLWSIDNLTITGSSNTTSTGGIYVGNGAAESGFTAYVSFRNLDIRNFNSATAIGMFFENPSHMSLENVNIDQIPFGTAHKITANMAVTGLFSYNACKFGERNLTHTAMLVTADGSGSAVANLSFQATFFGSTNRSILFAQTTSGAGNHRSVVFNACHTEQVNAAADSYCWRFESIDGLVINSPTWHGTNPTPGDEVHYGLVLRNLGDIRNVTVNNPFYRNIRTEVTRIDFTGSGEVKNVNLTSPVGSNDNATVPTLITDNISLSHNQFRIIDQPRALQNMIQNGSVEVWTGGPSVAPDGWVLGGTGAGTVARSAVPKIDTYSAEVQQTGAGSSTILYYDITHYTQYKDSIVTFGAWVKCEAGNIAKLVISDSVGSDESAVAVDDDTWQWLTVNRIIDSSATYIRATFWVNDDLFTASARFDGAILVSGEGVREFTPSPKD